MKKGLLVILLIIFLAGCNKEKFYLEEKYYNNSSFEEIDNSSLRDLEANKESFLIMVYTSGCFSCMDFEKVVTEFTNEYNLHVFRININDIEKTKLANKIKYTPSLVIYQNGKVYKYLDANSDKDTNYYKSTTNLKGWLDQYILLDYN